MVMKSRVREADDLTMRTPQDDTANGTTIAVNLGATVLFGVVTLAYFRQALLISGNSLWLDEVLAVWTARSPDIPALWFALLRGSEFTPPAFDLLLHGIIKLGFTDPLAMRLPSIAAIYIAALAIGWFVRRRSSWPLAALAAAIVLTSGVFDYAVQARPYACLTAMIAIALLVWDSLPEFEPMGWRAATLAALLCLAMSLHFYAGILLGLFAMGELCWSLAKRRIRWPVLGAIGVACASILLWLPLIIADAKFLAADRGAAAYYGRPSLEALWKTYSELSGVLLLEPLGILLALFFWRRVTLGRQRGSAIDGPWIGAALFLVSVPLVVFAFSVLVTHSYERRYTLTFVLGLALLFTYAVSRLDRKVSQVAALASLATIAIGAQHLHAPTIESPRRQAAIAVAMATPRGQPLATFNGGRFIEVAEAVPNLVSDLMLLRTPFESADPTNFNQAVRWASIRSDLQVTDLQYMLRVYDCFRLLSDRSDLYENSLDRSVGPTIAVRQTSDVNVPLYHVGQCTDRSREQPRGEK